MANNSNNKYSIMNVNKYYTNNKYFSGAGTIFVEIDQNNEIILILPCDRIRNKYIDFGGSVDIFDASQKDDQLVLTAMRETYEESCCLIKFSKVSDFNNKNYIDLAEYRGYFIFVKPNTINRIDYLNNYQILNKDPYFDLHYKETTDVTKIKLSDLIKYRIMTTNNNLRFICQNIYGDQILIHNRAIELIKKAITQNLFANYYNNVTQFKRIVNPNKIITLVSF